MNAHHFLHQISGPENIRTPGRCEYRKKTFAALLHTKPQVFQDFLNFSGVQRQTRQLFNARRIKNDRFTRVRHAACHNTVGYGATT